MENSSHLLHKGKLVWKGVEHEIELFESCTADGLNPVKQVQAVPFVNNKSIVIFKHVDGYYGLPGGGIEENEDFETALRRELKEEISCVVKCFGMIGYVKNTRANHYGSTKYQLRYWAEVELLNEPINDPCGKAVSREIVSLAEAINKLEWGDRGEILLKLAAERYNEFCNKKL